MLRTCAIAVSTSRRLLQPHSVGQYLSLCSITNTRTPQMGKRLTPQEVKERRAKRAEGKDMNRDKALFIEGSLRPYHRHFVIVEPPKTDPMSWPKRLEQTPEHILHLYMNALIKIYDGDADKARKCPLLLTAAIPYAGMCCDGFQGDAEKRLEAGTHDILVFPDAVRVQNIVPSQISTLVTMSLDKHLELASWLELENLQYSRLEEGYHMMVCGHAARDERCGCKGPQLLKWLKQLAAGVNKPLNLWTSSHFGGHRYAASFIVYPSGDWFGLLNDKESVQRVMSAINDDNPLQMYELWRGRMGLTVHSMYQAVKETQGG